ncbi:MAG: DUF3048 domain-containing protein [Lachnospiraceae bacterium]|nr:DUF3048 domain-containing protein [Lachnospiraceae bacterium]
MKGFLKGTLAKIITAGIVAATILTPSMTAHAAINELTGLPIRDEIALQRPIAVMIDNEVTALNHYGVNQADIVYEMMNSTANGRVTRLMAIVKDWGSVSMLGSIRSTRPTNVLLAAEYNAILIHDGGPFYINDYIAKPYTNHISGGFARVANGKNWEFTEYVTAAAYQGKKWGGGTQMYAGLASRIAASGFSTTYNAYYPGQHFTFSATPVNLGGTSANVVDMSGCFTHNKSKLLYNATTGTYDYYEYNRPHVDALNGQTTSFKNVILQCADFLQYDPHGYMIYYLFSANYPAGGNVGFYATNGTTIPVYWVKGGDYDHPSPTKYYNAYTGEEIRLNPGKTYIGILPFDTWGNLRIY